MTHDVQVPSTVRPVTAAGPAIAFTPLAGALLAEADTDAQWAADAADVSVRELNGLAAVTAACQLWGEVWQVRPGQPLPVGPDLMQGLAKAGGYASGAYDAGSGELIGACLGFFGEPRQALMHTHILGARPTGPGRNVALALAAHQRAWCLHRGITTMQWTFDPLVRRNAYLYLIKFAASPTEYLQNFYGAMSGAINGDTETDRMLVQRDLRLGVVRPAPADPPSAALPLIAPAITSLEAELSRGATVALGADPGGWPLAETPGTGPGQPLLVGVPTDIEDIRRTDPSRAAAWRQALRDVLAPLMSAGARVTGFDRAGWYVLSPGHPAELSTELLTSYGPGNLARNRLFQTSRALSKMGLAAVWRRAGGTRSDGYAIAPQGSTHRARGGGTRGRLRLPGHGR